MHRFLSTLIPLENYSFIKKNNMKILYGVPGEGMGHATRSKVIIAHLLQNHDVQVLSSSRAYKFLNESFGKDVLIVVEELIIILILICNIFG